MFSKGTQQRRSVVLLLAGVLGSACSESNPAGPAGADASDAGCATFDSTFEAIQSRIFERRGCTADACHGESAQGELDLRPDVAYENLLEVPSENSDSLRINPGKPNDSYLFQKLLAGT